MAMPFESPEKSAANRAAKLAVLRKLMVKHIERTDAQAQNVEQALAMLAEATARVRSAHQ
ncbi:hypothetical protein [Mesorhizobium sp. NZP2077]|uniref:hypothetical protein n=1 Tax=Mesorhizobium sp. NZP2077 TaxID=2483404 RepID=UPI0015518326|nr:hypothetical protein [Mesorhizobium sp. NZP2077]QKC80787.1 hypothetical protein EB232_03140 [Mesorhizobium sp. NZP2077]QKD14183.1 hypothetical protein HGP13_03120 [Mesorhizobium sp. NZP2077]